MERVSHLGGKIRIAPGHLHISVGGDDVLGVQQVDQFIVVFTVRMAADVQILENADTRKVKVCFDHIPLPEIHRVGDHRCREDDLVSLGKLHPGAR